MEHLTLETLSRLLDEPASSEEQAHLERCGRCASELEALRAQTLALAALPDVRPPRGDWEGLATRLLEEGLLQADEPAPELRPRVRAPWMRRAAAVTLFLGGAAAGAAAGRMVQAPAARQVAEAAPAAVAADPGTALAQVQDAERAYMEALVHYRRLVDARAGAGLASDPRTRYAALEEIVRAGQAAVSQAPTDPFLNGVLASALAEQQAVSRLDAPDAPASAAQDGWF